MQSLLVLLISTLCGSSLAYLDFNDVIPHSTSTFLSYANVTLTLGVASIIDIAHKAKCPDLMEISGTLPNFCTVHPGVIHNYTFH